MLFMVKYKIVEILNGSELPSFEWKDLDDFNPIATSFKARVPLLLDMLSSPFRMLATTDFSAQNSSLGHLRFPSFLLISKEVSPWHVLLSEQKHHRVRSGVIFGDSPLGTLPLPPNSGTARVNVRMSITEWKCQKNVVHEIISPNGVTRTIFLDESSFDSGLEGYAVFLKNTLGKVGL